MPLNAGRGCGCRWDSTSFTSSRRHQPGPLEEEWIPLLSFPDASGRTQLKSTRGEFSSPLDSGFHPERVPGGPPVDDSRQLDSSSARTAAAAAGAAKDETPLSFGEVCARSKYAELCNDRYPEEGEAEEAGGGRATAGAPRRLHVNGKTRGCGAPSGRVRFHCAPLTHSLSPGTQDARSHAASTVRAGGKLPPC